MTSDDFPNDEYDDFLSDEHDDLVVSSLDYINYIEHHVPPVPPLYSGMEMLDKYLEGFFPGEFYLLSGKPKHGKSLFMKTLIKQFYHQGALSIVFSFEERPQQFFKTFEDGGRNLLFYVPRHRTPYNIPWMFKRALEAKEKYGVQVMFVDSGQFLIHMIQNASLASIISDAIGNMKDFAVDNELVIFLIWHLKKNDDITLKSLNDSMLRDSGMLSAYSDGLLFNYREVESNGLTTIESSYLKIAHHRRTSTMEVVIPLIKQGYYFREIE